MPRADPGTEFGKIHRKMEILFLKIQKDLKVYKKFFGEKTLLSTEALREL